MIFHYLRGVESSSEDVAHTPSIIRSQSSLVGRAVLNDLCSSTDDMEPRVSREVKDHLGC